MQDLEFAKILYKANHESAFRSDSSSQIGFGHIKRDLVLAKQYSDVSFACLPLEGSLIDEILILFMSLIVKAFTNLSISSKKKI